MCALSNPGSIPKIRRKYQPQIPYLGKKIEQKVVLCNQGVECEIKYCSSCKAPLSYPIGNIYRPPRSSHCRHCNRCIQRFDHHCPLLGTCIGEGNYRSYIAFVSLSAFTNFRTLVRSSFLIFYLLESFVRAPINPIRAVSWTFC